MVSEERTVQCQALLLQHPYGDLHSCLAQFSYTFSVHLVEAVATPDYHSWNTFLYDEVGTRRCLAIVGTRFKTHIHRSFAQQVLFAYRAYGIDLSMRAAALAMISLTDNLAIVYDYRSHHRVGGCVKPTVCGQL